MIDERPTIAAFDVDGTLTTRDCVVPFMRRVTGARRIVPRLLRRPDRLVPVLARRDRDELKARAAAAAFTGATDTALRTLGREFAAHVHANWLRSDTVRTLQDHLRNGHRVVLVSASFEVYLDPFAELLGADDALATRLRVDNGVITGELDGPNCRGPEKVRRLHDWLDRHHGGRSANRIVAYGDSAGDRELLADADEAHWIGRGAA